MLTPVHKGHAPASLRGFPVSPHLMQMNNLQKNSVSCQIYINLIRCVRVEEPLKPVLLWSEFPTLDLIQLLSLWNINNWLFTDIFVCLHNTPEYFTLSQELQKMSFRSIMTINDSWFLAGEQPFSFDQFSFTAPFEPETMFSLSFLFLYTNASGSASLKNKDPCQSAEMVLLSVFLFNTTGTTENTERVLRWTYNYIFK